MTDGLLVIAASSPSPHLPVEAEAKQHLDRYRAQEGALAGREGRECLLVNVVVERSYTRHLHINVNQGVVCMR